jgi:hydrogenase large subunit
MKTVTISPVNRVEGDLEISVDIEDNRIVNAYASGVMFRGFETILKGRDPMDAIVFTPRICGICCSAHSTTAANALRSAFSAEIPPNGFRGRNIVFGTETVMSHLTHFYALFGADLVNEAYKSRPFYEELVKRFTPFKGSSYHKLIRARKDLLQIIGLFVGKWPNHLGFHPGGMTCTLSYSEIARAKGVLIEFKEFVEEVLLGCALDRWLGIRSLEELERWAGEAPQKDRDLALFITLAPEIGLHSIGKGPEKFLSFGAYELSENVFWIKNGFYDGQQVLPFDQSKIAEDIKYSWFIGYEGQRHPLEGMTEPDIEKEDAYSWIKSPRYEGHVVEVGPLARMVIHNEPLIMDMFKKLGANVFTRVIARIHEAIKTLKEIDIWLDEINLKEPFYKPSKEVDVAQGIGLTEAARGCLGHWVVIEDKKIKRYQVITPTAWNASPRDANGNPGAIESALIGLPIKDEDNPVEIGHVIRSFDPCLVCSVHTFHGDKKISSFKLH